MRHTCKACGHERPAFAFGAMANGKRREVCSPCRRAAARGFATVAEEAKAEEAPLQAAERAPRNAARLEREERAAAIRDDIWSAMKLGRSRRALDAVKAHRTDMHRIQTKHDGGFISIAEFACRCAEREATSRAARTCKTYESASAAMRILEQATPTVERAIAVYRLWRTAEAQHRPSAPKASLSEPEADEVDPFDDALGDWAPAWMRGESLHRPLEH